jgi:hypothetical protein
VQKMKRLVALIGLIALAGCHIPLNERIDASDAGVMSDSDLDVARNFLDALYRPNNTSYQVYPDASSEEGMGHIPLAARNQVLRERLNQLRRAPGSIIAVNLDIPDQIRPDDSRHVLYSYDTSTGRFEAASKHKIGDVSTNMWITIKNWPNGTRLVNLRQTWIDDDKDSIFHLRCGEQSFRFAIAIAPVT